LVQEPLRGFNYSDLILTGTAKVKKHWIACVLTPDGKTFVMKKGSPIGDSFGYVDAIDAYTIKVVEPFNANRGDQWVQRSFLWPIVTEKSFRKNCVE
jgi:Tfp pilus assembly protein PilP